MNSSEPKYDRKWHSLPVRPDLKGLINYASAFPVGPTNQAQTTYLLVNQLLENEWLPRPQIADQQFRQLCALLQFAEQQCPFYTDRIRSCGLNPTAMKSLDDFSRMPLLTRTDLQDNFDLMRARTLPTGTREVGEMTTTGSTASPVKVLLTSKTVAFWNACCMRDFVWSDLDPKGKLVSLRYFPRTPQRARTTEGQERPDWGAPITHLFSTGPSFLMDVCMGLEAQLSLLLHADPDYILSFPSNLELLGQVLSQSGQKLKRLKQICTIGEVLPDVVRQNIESLFCARVWDLYSAREVGYIASQCPSGHGYHVHGENVLVEVLDDDGHPCRPGQAGRVVVTSLMNYGLPLIRYDIGDYAATIEDPCPCGRTLSRLSHIIGRQRGQLIRPDGRIMFSHYLNSGIRKVGAIRQFQVIQHERDRIEVIVVPMAGFGPEQERQILETFQSEFGCPIRVTVTCVPHIERTPGGKYLDFVCKTK
jgi:phenylacetate-CoA ligase